MSQQRDPFGGSTIPQAPVAHNRLSVNGLSVEIHMPQALVSKFGPDGEELDQGLPPYNLRPGYLVDECPNAPDGWQRSDAGRKAASFMTIIKPEHGLWLNFNQNGSHRHDVAAVVSVQGVNAITGQPVTGLGLEQYVNRCPVHGTPFGLELYCAGEGCKFKWPSQNYLASTGSGGHFWLDGFRAPDGAVRQYVFTTDVERGVAQQIIGPNQQEAIGIVFYLSKEPKPEPVRSMRGPVSFGGLEGLGMAKGGFESLESCEESVQVAAGARIKQQVHKDPKPIDYWQDEPAGMLYIYYATEDRARVVMGLPPRNPEGFLGGIKHGHNPNSGKA